MGLMDLFKILFVVCFIGILSAAFLLGCKFLKKRQEKTRARKTPDIYLHSGKTQMQNHLTDADMSQKQLENETKKTKCFFERECRYLDEDDFLHHVKDGYFRSGENKIIKKTTKTIMDAHNAARSSQRVIFCQISSEELRKDMQMSDGRMGTLKDGKFNGSLARLLEKKYEEGFGVEKAFKQKGILLADGKYYLQKIECCVTRQGNGKPITRCVETVYPISTSDIDKITPENIETYLVSERVFQDMKTEAGVCF